MEVAIGVLGIAVVVLLAIVIIQAWVISRLANGLEASLPAGATVMFEMAVKHQDELLTALKEQAAKTITQVDDRAISLLEMVLPFALNQAKEIVTIKETTQPPGGSATGAINIDIGEAIRKQMQQEQNPPPVAG